MNEPLSILLPYQRRWLADQSQVKVSEKSRRIGITWTEAADRALGAATTGRAGIDGWYIGTTKIWRWSLLRRRRGGRGGLTERLRRWRRLCSTMSAPISWHTEFGLRRGIRSLRCRRGLRICAARMG